MRIIGVLEQIGARVRSFCAQLRTRTSCDFDPEELYVRLEDVGELEGDARKRELIGRGDGRVRAGGRADGVYGLLLRGQRYSVSSNIPGIYIRTSSSPRCLLGVRRRWAPMPEAVEPGAGGSFFFSFFDGHGGAGGLRRFEGYLTSLDDSPAPRPIYFCTAPPGLYLVSCTAVSITVGVSCLVASLRAQWRSHLPRFWNAHRASWTISLVFISRRMMPVGALL